MSGSNPQRSAPVSAFASRVSCRTRSETVVPDCGRGPEDIPRRGRLLRCTAQRQLPRTHPWNSWSARTAGLPSYPWGTPALAATVIGWAKRRRATLKNGLAWKGTPGWCKSTTESLLATPRSGRDCANKCAVPPAGRRSEATRVSIPVPQRVKSCLTTEIRAASTRLRRQQDGKPSAITRTGLCFRQGLEPRDGGNISKERNSESLRGNGRL